MNENWLGLFNLGRQVRNETIFLGEQDFSKNIIIVKDSNNKIIECPMFMDEDNNIYFIYKNIGVYISDYLGEFEINNKDKTLLFNTNHMNYKERLESFEKGNVVPIGTVCYRKGDILHKPKKYIVDNDNQRRISMWWNCMYFLTEKEAI